MPAKRWTDEERRYLIANVADGSFSLSFALGRTEGAVEWQARKLGLRISRWPKGGELCPVCGRYYVRGGSRAAKRGLCAVCYADLKAEAVEKRTAYVRAVRRYDAAKHRERRRRDGQ